YVWALYVWGLWRPVPGGLCPAPVFDRAGRGGGMDTGEFWERLDKERTLSKLRVILFRMRVIGGEAQCGFVQPPRPLAITRGMFDHSEIVECGGLRRVQSQRALQIRLCIQAAVLLQQGKRQSVVHRRIGGIGV